MDAPGSTALLHGAGWSGAAAVVLALVLAGGVALNLVRHRRREAPAPPVTLDRRDALAGLLVLGALLLRLLLLERSPVSGDEASNLEIDFWSAWYLSFESRANPPLFRWLIHLTSTVPERLWLIRLPAALFGGLALWLFYRMARQRSSWGVALALTAVLSFDAMQLDYALEQKSYTLWLCLLLAAHHSLRRALDGHDRHWAVYALWALLATLTHYLTPVYLLGHLAWVRLRWRSRLVDVVLAQVPAVAALAVMAVPVLATGAAAVSSRDPGQGWLVHALQQTLSRGTGLGLALVLLALVGRPKRAPGPGDGALPWLLALGVLGPLLLGLRTPLWARYFFPVLPFGLLWLAGRLDRRPRRWALRQRVLVGLGLAVVLAGGLVELVGRVADRPSDPLLSAYRRSTPEPVLVIHPAWRFQTVVFELTGRRDTWNNACPGASPGWAIQEGERLVIGVDSTMTGTWLDQALQRLGRLDLLRYRSRDGSGSAAVDRWLARRCRVLAEVPADGDETHRAFRCGDGPLRPMEPCAALGEASGR